MTSAQVVLTPSSLPRAEQVAKQFAAAGFQVGPVVGVSFSITGPVELFERFFRVKATAGERPFAADELPVSALDPGLRSDVKIVLFTRPPDFGPGGQF
ncbi:MAG TPA: hypothetical protein VKE74_04415 [Gemmataceae bacterium]|nr:hypothetical protein [Gemmataceae bacterium]